MCGESADFELHSSIVAISKEGREALKSETHDNMAFGCVGCVIRMGMMVKQNKDKYNGQYMVPAPQRQKGCGTLSG